MRSSIQYGVDLSEFDGSQIGLLYCLELRGQEGERVNVTNAYYRAYVSRHRDVSVPRWLSDLHSHRLIEPAYERGQDRYRITFLGADLLRHFDNSLSLKSL